MLLRTSRLTRQRRVWQNRTGWKFQFAHINPETKYQKSICENAVWNLCLAVGENEAEALKEPQCGCSACSANPRFYIHLLPEWPQSSAHPRMQEMLQQGHCSAQVQEHIWPLRLFSCSEVTPKHSSRIPYRNPELSVARSCSETS